jgi:hypothetical protein
MVGIGHPRALVGAFIPTAEGADSPKMEFFNIVARLKLGLVELSYTLDQGGQTRVHRRFFPLSLDDWREQKLVLPKRLDVHIYQKSFLLQIFLATLEECRNILVSMVAAQR